eukprot:5905339-Pyramimonas_sp.AAC.1
MSQASWPIRLGNTKMFQARFDIVTKSQRVYQAIWPSLTGNVRMSQARWSLLIKNARKSEANC